MSQTEMYRQCLLHRELEGGVTQIDHAWIPNALAKVGKTLSIKNDRGVWEEGWVVQEAYTSRPYTDLMIEIQTQRKFKGVLRGGCCEDGTGY